jgi:hypothetical protein
MELSMDDELGIDTSVQLELHYPIASFDLSGAKIGVGTYSSNHQTSKGSVWIKHEDMVEPAYMSPTETKLLIAALKTAIYKLEHD